MVAEVLLVNLGINPKSIVTSRTSICAPETLDWEQMVTPSSGWSRNTTVISVTRRPRRLPARR
jgi:hypothetical protein